MLTYTIKSVPDGIADKSFETLEDFLDFVEDSFMEYYPVNLPAESFLEKLKALN